MSSADVTRLVVAFLLVVIAAFLAAAETAIARVSRARVHELAVEGRRGAVPLSALVDDPASAVNALLLVRAIAETTAVVLVTVTLVDLLPSEAWGAALTVVVMVAVSYLLVGVAPRTLGRQHAESYALAVARPVRWLSLLLAPLTRTLIVLGNALTPGRGFRDGPFASEAELRDLVDLAERTSVIEHDEREMIHSVFELGDTIVREVMVPRPDMVVIEHGRTLRQAMSLALRSGFSRIPVVGENVDDVRGVVYLKDLARHTFEHRHGDSVKVESVMRPAVFVPDSKPAAELLRDMQAQRTHVAIVVDEYGGTAGLVTIEDVLEEIVGDIADEYDTGAPEIQQLPDGDVRVSSRLNVWDFAERFQIPLDHDDEDDVDTVGGLLAKRLGKVPIAGSTVVVDGYRLVAESLAGRRNRISTVLVQRIEADPAPAPEQTQRADA
ncbi:MAG TPA: hemolysin family protein [Actinomycetes bacterium]|nr:hemolysin family protein [Actinomycetes bacterium]